MKAIAFIGLCAFSLLAYGQDTNISIRKQAELRLFRETKPSLSSLQPKQLIPASTVPEKLPMFCALEKKLWAVSNVWIKIRLPERETFRLDD